MKWKFEGLLPDFKSSYGPVLKLGFTILGHKFYVFVVMSEKANLLQNMSKLIEPPVIF